ncbi:hypothetical protein TNCV_3863831 [Trichonephila clavipes]|nr:hypothetical protein TNCV_3863831 [Trichonephila clavipes]
MFDEICAEVVTNLYGTFLLIFLGVFLGNINSRLFPINSKKRYGIFKLDKKNVKSGKGPLTPAGLLKLIKRFEETGKLEDRARAGRPCLKEARAPCIAVEMEAIASEAASGTSSAREAARRLGLPPSSVRSILRRLLQLYPYNFAILP